MLNLMFKCMVLIRNIDLNKDSMEFDNWVGLIDLI